MYGGATGQAPSQVSKKKIETQYQKRNWTSGKYWNPRTGERSNRGTKKRITILITKAITPPSLLGTARRMAYANKKYHSG